MGFFKKKTKALYAMANGQSIAIEDVPDEVFATKMMGDGIAIQPKEGKIYAPCNGKAAEKYFGYQRNFTCCKLSDTYHICTFGE